MANLDGTEGDELLLLCRGEWDLPESLARRGDVHNRTLQQGAGLPDFVCGGAPTSSRGRRSSTAARVRPPTDQRRRHPAASTGHPSLQS